MLNKIGELNSVILIAPIINKLEVSTGDLKELKINQKLF